MPRGCCVDHQRKGGEAAKPTNCYTLCNLFLRLVRFNVSFFFFLIVCRLSLLVVVVVENQDGFVIAFSDLTDS